MKGIRRGGLLRLPDGDDNDPKGPRIKKVSHSEVSVIRHQVQHLVVSVLIKKYHHISRKTFDAAHRPSSRLAKESGPVVRGR